MSSKHSHAAYDPRRRVVAGLAGGAARNSVRRKAGENEIAKVFNVTAAMEAVCLQPQSRRLEDGISRAPLTEVRGPEVYA